MWVSLHSSLMGQHKNYTQMEVFMAQVFPPGESSVDKSAWLSIKLSSISPEKSHVLGPLLGPRQTVMVGHLISLSPALLQAIVKL